MSKKILLTAGVVLGLTGLGNTALAEGVSEAELLASMCNTCHGTDGQGAKPVDDIAGLEVEDFVDTMKAYATKEDESTIMYRHAEGYTDEQIQALAEFFADK